jgi:hypothetical protein
MAFDKTVALETRAFATYVREDGLGALYEV